MLLRLTARNHPLSGGPTVGRIQLASALLGWPSTRRRRAISLAMRALAIMHITGITKNKARVLLAAACDNLATWLLPGNPFHVIVESIRGVRSMRKSRFSESQIIGIVKEHEAGLGSRTCAAGTESSGTTLYKWKAKFGGMDVSEAKS